jgi:hypothetical protein
VHHLYERARDAAVAEALRANTNQGEPKAH